jgi:inosine-uridine nucleoside N-ribohydrolase
VFASGIDLTMVGLDVTHKALFTGHEQRPEDGFMRVRALLKFTVSFTAGSTAGMPIHTDAAHVTRPDLPDTAERAVKRDTGLELSRGRRTSTGGARAGAECARAAYRRRRLPRSPR